MIAWATIDAAVKAAILVACPVVDVRWKWEPSRARKSPSVDLKRSPVARIGNDERRYAADGADLTATQVGQRQFTVEVRCTSALGSPSDTAPVDAADVLSVMMTRLWRPSVTDALSAAGCALSGIGQIVRTDFVVDKRDYGLAVVPVTFLCADVDTDSDEYWIESFTGTLTVTTPDGTELVVPFSGEVT